MTGGIALAPLYTEVRANISKFKSDMEKAKTAGIAAAKNMSNKLKEATKVGEGFQTVGKNLTRYVTLPVIAAGTASAKFALDAEQGFAKVSTVIDKTVVPIDKMKQEIIKLSNESGVAVKDFNEALYNSVSAGVESGKAIEFTGRMAKLAKGGFTDTSKAVDVVTTVLNSYGLEAEEAERVADKLITTQNLGKTTVDQLASSMGKVIPTAKGLNVDFSNVSATMAVLTKNGISTAEATTYYNSMLNELGKSGTNADKVLRKVAKKGFADLVKEGKPVPEILKILAGEAKKTGKSLADMFGSSEAAKAAQVIMKDGGVEYNEILKQMEGSAGATQKAFETMDSTPLENIKKSLNRLKNAGIEIGQVLLPVVGKGVEKIAELTKKFSALSPEQKEMIVKTGLIVAAIGPLLTVTGKLISGFAMAKTAVVGISSAISSAGGAMTLLTGPVGLAIAGIAGLAVGGVALYRHLSEDAVPAVDLFKGSVNGMAVTVSDETKKTIGAYMEMDDSVTKSMYSMKVNNQIVTQDIVNDMTNKVNQMGEQIKAGIQQKSEATIKMTTDMFMASDQVIDEHEQNILNKITTQGQNQIAMVEFNTQEINRIQRVALEENRALTQEEYDKINLMQSQMREIAITELSATEEEAAVIRQRMNDYQGRLSVEMASELLTNAAKARDGQIQSANQTYDGVIREASRLKQAGIITEEEYNTMVNKAKENKEKQISNANEAYNGVKNEITKASPGIENAINMQTGAIESRWNRMWKTVKQDAGELVSSIKAKSGELWNAGKQWVSNMFDGLKSGLGNLKSAGQDMIGNFFAGIKSKWGECTGWVSEKINELKNKFNPKNLFGGGSGGGSHYNGLSYVPFDGYNARLHKGERVLTAEENREYTQKGNRNGGGDTYNFYSNKSIDEREAARQLRRVNRLRGEGW